MRTTRFLAKRAAAQQNLSEDHIESHQLTVHIFNLWGENESACIALQRTCYDLPYTWHSQFLPIKSRQAGEQLEKEQQLAPPVGQARQFRVTAELWKIYGNAFIISNKRILPYQMQINFVSWLKKTAKG